GHDQLVDAVAALVLAGIAVFGFDHVYLDRSYLAVGLIGAAAGIGAAYATIRLRLNALVAAAVGVVAFVVFGAASVPTTAIAGVLPGPQTPGALLSGVIHGWADLLTTAPPVGLPGGLGVIPYVCGFVAGGAAMVLATSRPWPLVPVTPSFVVLLGGFAL